MAVAAWITKNGIEFMPKTADDLRTKGARA